MSILYAISDLFSLELDSNVVNITDFTLWNLNYFILTESKLLSFSTHLRTSTSLFISCRHPVIWVICFAHASSWNSGILLQMILFVTCTAYLAKFQTLSLYVCCTTIFEVFHVDFFFMLTRSPFVCYLALLTLLHMVKVFNTFHII